MGKLTNLTVKGQVTIPKDVRDALGLKAGEPVAIEMRSADEAVIRKVVPKTLEKSERIEAFRAKLARAIERGKPLPLGMTVDEYMATIREPVPDPRPR